MAQLERHQFAHWLNTATTTGETTNPSYKREGTGVESLSVAFNPQKDTYKDITQRTAKTTFKSYQLSSSVTGKRCYTDDPVYDYMYNLKKLAIAGETQLVEVNTAKTVSAGVYEATQYKVLVTITEWLGEDAVISYDYDYSDPVQGTATVSGDSISFTATTSL